MQRQNLRSVNNTKSPLSFKSAIKDIHTPKGRYAIYAILTMSIVAPILQKMIGLVASDNIALYITLGIMVIGLFCVAFKMDKISEVINRHQLDKLNQRLKNKTETNHSDA